MASIELNAQERRLLRMFRELPPDFRLAVEERTQQTLAGVRDYHRSFAQSMGIQKSLIEARYDDRFQATLARLVKD